MATNTYVALATQTVGTAVNSVTFSSIVATYTDLVIVMQTQCATADANISLQFNADTASNYSYTMLDGSGTTTYSSRGSNQTSGAVDNYGQIQQNFKSNDIINIFNYSNTTTYKTYTSRSNNAGMGLDAIVGLWKATPAAINSVKFICSGSRNFDVGSTFSLYGISTVGDATPKATGGDVFSDATYWYHAFSMSGDFVPNQSITADVLVIAGGGGAGAASGGGGAGGVQYATSQSLTAQRYPVIIGGGGTTSAGAGVGVKGSDSTFNTSTIIANGGGGGCRINGGTTSGGSGGGVANGQTPGSSSSGTGGTFYGYAGSAGAGGSYGGGGGAGAAGSTTAGGAGLNTWSSWASATSTGVSGYYAGGGGAVQTATSGPFAGGIGGGGAGGISQNPTATAGTSGTQSTGGGGGGGGIGTVTDGLGGLGGSGIVIVRYAKV